MGDSIEKRTCKHIPCTGQILGMAWERRNVNLFTIEPHEGSMRSVGDNAIGHHTTQRMKSRRARFGRGNGLRFRCIAKQQVGALQSIMKRIAENRWDKCFGTGHSHLGPVMLRDVDGFSNRMLPGLRIRKHVTFDEQPRRFRNALFIDMLVGKMTRNAQTGAHRSLGIGGDQCDACTRRLTEDHRISDVNTERLELFDIVKPVSVVPNASDKRATATQLRQTDDGVRHRSTADQLQFMGHIGEPLEQLLLLLEID